MTKMGILGTILAIVFSVSMVGSAFAAANFLTVADATIGEDSTLTTKTPIPTNGNKGAFGYGIIGSTGAVLVATTHGGVGPDSDEQEDQFDPVMHIHTVTLDAVEGCDGPGVTSITDESDDMKAIVDGKTLVMRGYTGQVGALSSTVASFTLSVIGDPASPTAVCVNDLQVFDFS